MDTEKPQGDIHDLSEADSQNVSSESTTQTPLPDTGKLDRYPGYRVKQSYESPDSGNKQDIAMLRELGNSLFEGDTIEADVQSTVADLKAEIAVMEDPKFLAAVKRLGNYRVKQELQKRGADGNQYNADNLKKLDSPPLTASSNTSTSE